MAQKKGKTGNPNGRPKGTPNKVTSDLRTWINDLLNENRGQFAADLKKLEPQQRVMMLEKLLSYTVPKMQSVEAKIAQRVAPTAKEIAAYLNSDDYPNE